MFLIYIFIRLFLRITVPGSFIIEKSYHYCFLTLTVFCSHTPSMHGIAAITGNMHRSLRYFVLLERITSNNNNSNNNNNNINDGNNKKRN